MVSILETDTLETLLQRQQEQEEAIQRTAFDNAKNNMQRLLIMGVLCTPEDEQTSAYQWSAAEKRAQAEGRSIGDILAEDNHKREILRLKGELEWIVGMGETRQEHADRIQAILAATPRLIKGCRHNNVKRWEDWGDVEDEPRVVLFKCPKCGAENKVNWNQSNNPTSQALLAKKLLGVE